MNLPEQVFSLKKPMTETDIAIRALNDLLLQLELLGERNLNIRYYLGPHILGDGIVSPEINEMLSRTESSIEIIGDSPLTAINDIKARKLKRAK